jgi:thioester reductase-like protein
MIRSGKGTIQRQGTVAQYATEIDQLYERADTELSGAERASIDIKNANQVSQFIKQAISKVEPALLQEGEDNFFALGMDSLTAVQLVRALRHGFGDPNIEVSVIYNNPSLSLLSRHFDRTDATRDESGATHSQSELETLLAEYEQKLAPHQVKLPKTNESNGEVVILTGSSGSLGTHLLEALLQNPGIAHVYCLNRRVDAQDIYETKARATGFPLDQHNDRVTFVHAVVSQDNLGLDEKMYNLIHSTATLIIHNAWSVNFIQPLKTFTPQFDGLVNLFRFASSREEPPRLLYISSISSVAQLSKGTASSIPEEVVGDMEAPYALGYAKSKLLSEVLCDTAARRLGILTSFARVGQIAGPVNGNTVAVWNTAEWLPSLIITSISLGFLPDSLGIELNKVDWMPVDILAKGVVEIGTHLTAGAAGAEVFNVLNSKHVSWGEIIPSITASVKEHSGKRMDVVPLSVWLQKLQETAEGYTADASHLVLTHPAIKLQEFYESRMLESKHVVNWETGRTLDRSKALREMPAVSGKWVEKWVEGWAAEMKTWEK